MVSKSSDSEESAATSSPPSRRQRREEESAKAPRNWQRAVSIVIQIFAWTLAGVLAAIIVLTVVLPRIIGAEPFTVVSGSMEPTIPTGSIVVSEHVDPQEVTFGDVVTYQLHSGQPLTVTHRIVGVDIIDGRTRYRTQGDANSAEDPLPVRPAQIRGVVRYHIPFVGYLGQLIPLDRRQGLATIVGVGLIGYAVIILIRGIIERRRGSRDATSQQDDP